MECETDTGVNLATSISLNIWLATMVNSGQEHNSWKSAADAGNPADDVQAYRLTLPPLQSLLEICRSVCGCIDIAVTCLPELCAKFVQHACSVCSTQFNTRLNCNIKSSIQLHCWQGLPCATSELPTISRQLENALGALHRCMPRLLWLWDSFKSANVPASSNLP